MFDTGENDRSAKAYNAFAFEVQEDPSLHLKKSEVLDRVALYEWLAENELPLTETVNAIQQHNHKRGCHAVR